ncbi:uncharacterized protein [Periplaneta americana]|uniref:uncharacterized protein isoform X4 n=1 Tax=Periplaneta americana TaxID=6978 RepID=UPI0037E7424B
MLTQLSRVWFAHDLPVGKLCLQENNVLGVPNCRRDTGGVVMEVIKEEPEVDPLAIQWNDNTDTDEKKLLSEEGNLLDLHETEIKTECIDRSCKLESDITFEETPVSIHFPIVKSEAEWSEVNKEELSEQVEVEEEVKLEVAADGNEVLSERIFRIAYIMERTMPYTPTRSHSSVTSVRKLTDIHQISGGTYAHTQASCRINAISVGKHLRFPWN